MVKILHEESKRLLSNILVEENSRLISLKNYHKGSYEHSCRVGLLTIDLGYDNYSNEEINLALGYSGILHDIGKLKIPIEILAKPGKLTDEERLIMRRHARFSYLELKEDKKYKLIRKVIVMHHEFKKQTAYPRKGKDRRDPLRGDPERRNENVLARELTQILAIADIYDALASPRDYKTALPREKVISIIEEEYTGNKKYLEQLIQRI